MQFSDIQKVYVISLPGSPRREVVRAEMNKHNISFEFWDGIENKQDGAKGLKDTFECIFATCLMKGFNTVAIFEDDAIFLTNMAITEINWVLEDLPDDFHICKFGANLLTPVDKVANYLNRTKMSYALHAALYSREGMQQIMKCIYQEEPIDVIIAKGVEPLCKSYVSSKMIVTQRVTKSSIFVYDSKRHNKSFADKYLTDDGEIRWDLFMEESWERNTKHLI